MGANTVLWIDHRKAIIVTFTDQGETIRHVVSRVESQPRRSGDSPLKGPYETRLIPADDSHERKFAGRLAIYYDTVMAALLDAKGILILGPGEAKIEMKKHLENGNLGDRILAMESADKMTDRQVAAKARSYYHEESHRSGLIRTKRPGGLLPQARKS